ncbi:MAG: hypothetical protein RMX68_002895 [Aulosira sp. ZfuVER01]|nr:hypothetical protein [Aulosira sp. ZfuVER01]MDZ7996619.1 hypothetical protein [Aulosira sp. DedVER01a]MDZ8052992.1 hypothetical protein [Aulosira sp. ZfuCHP01]
MNLSARPQLLRLSIIVIGSVAVSCICSAVSRVTALPLPKFGVTQQVTPVLECAVTKWSNIELLQINTPGQNNQQQTSFALDFIQSQKFSRWEHESTSRILQLEAGSGTVLTNSLIQLFESFTAEPNEYAPLTGKLSFKATKQKTPHPGLNQGVNGGDYLVQISGQGTILAKVKDNLGRVFAQAGHPSAKNPLSFYCDRVASDSQN